VGAALVAVVALGATVAGSEVPPAHGVAAACFTQANTATAPAGTSEPSAVAGVYQISSKAELVWLSWAASDFNIASSGVTQADALAGDYLLTATIDLADCLWTPIGPSWEAYFSGTMDGGLAYEIQNLTVFGGSRQNWLGFFGIASAATLENIRLVDVDISGVEYNQYVGGLLGIAAVFNDYGDFVGEPSEETPFTAYPTIISDSFVTGSVSGAGKVGGLVGDNRATILRSYSSAAVTCSGDNKGGLVGYNNGLISQSFATGSVTGERRAGGLVGTNEYEGRILNSYASGALTDAWYYSGGLVASNSGGAIENSYSIGAMTVPGSAFLGGLVGYNSGSVTSSFWDVETSTQSATGVGTPKSTASMTTIATFTTDLGGLAWEMVAAEGSGDPTGESGQVWGIGSGLNSGYPFLWWESATVSVSGSSGDSGSSGSGSSDSGSSAESSEAASESEVVKVEAEAKPFVRPTRAVTEAVTGPVLRGGVISKAPSSPQILVGGRRTVVTNTVPSSTRLDMRAGQVNLAIEVEQNSGSVSQTVGGATELSVKKGSAARLQGSGLEPGSVVQVFLPLAGDRSEQLAQITVGADGSFSGNASFESGSNGVPLPVGRNVLQLVSQDEFGEQVVLEMAVTIEQGDPAPERNRRDGAVPTMQPGQSVATSAGEPIDLIVTPVPDQKIAVFEGDGWSMAVNVNSGQGSVEPTEGGAMMTLAHSAPLALTGAGFMPGTRVDVWLFSEPTLLGTATIDENGEFVGEVTIDPSMVPVGEHTLQLQGVAVDGYTKAASLGVVVEALDTAPVEQDPMGFGLIWWVLSMAIVVVIAAVMVVAFRGRRR
jgi:hypothetical protein